MELTDADLIQNTECLRRALLHAAIWLVGGLVLFVAIQWRRYRPDRGAFMLWLVGARWLENTPLVWGLLGATCIVALGDFYLSYELCRIV